MLNVLDNMCKSLHLIWNACLLTLQQQQAIFKKTQMQACVPLVCTGLLGSHQMSAAGQWASAIDLATTACNVMVDNSTHAHTNSQYELTLDCSTHACSHSHCSLLVDDAGSTPDC